MTSSHSLTYRTVWGKTLFWRFYKMFSGSSTDHLFGLYTVTQLMQGFFQKTSYWAFGRVAGTDCTHVLSIDPSLSSPCWWGMRRIWSVPPRWRRGPRWCRACPLPPSPRPAQEWIHGWYSHKILARFDMDKATSTSIFMTFTCAYKTRQQNMSNSVSAILTLIIY